MSEKTKWYAVYTRPRWEKKVAEVLTHKKIECYCPINKVIRQWSDRRKIVHEPLFTSYVFVRVPETEFCRLKQIHGIINLVHWLGKPAVIRDVEIDIIKRFLNEHVNIKLEKTPINVNDKVKILGGPLMEMEGQVLSIKNKTIKVALPSLGYLMYAEIEASNVEITERSGATEIEMHYPLHAAK
ncbi:MAG: UpxY family transcription antiterminator [Bacteroidetes bacterium]|nr:UpxY family transcription antiterminator [Bacteroidota bacterium]